MSKWRNVKLGEIFQIVEGGVVPTKIAEELKDRGVIEEFKAEKLGDQMWRAVLCEEDECLDTIIDTELSMAVVRLVGSTYIKARIVDIDELRELKVIRLSDNGGYMDPKFTPHFEMYKL